MFVFVILKEVTMETILKICKSGAFLLFHQSMLASILSYEKFSKLDENILNQEEQQSRNALEIFCQGIPTLKKIRAQFQDLPQKIQKEVEKCHQAFQKVLLSCKKGFGDDEWFETNKKSPYFGISKEIRKKIFLSNKNWKPQSSRDYWLNQNQKNKAFARDLEDPSRRRNAYFQPYWKRIQNFLSVYSNEIEPFINELKKLVDHYKLLCRSDDESRSIFFLLSSIEKNVSILRGITYSRYQKDASERNDWWNEVFHLLSSIQILNEICEMEDYSSQVQEKLNKEIHHELSLFVYPLSDNRTCEDREALKIFEGQKETHMQRFYRKATKSELHQLYNVSHKLACHRFYICDFLSFLDGLSLNEEQRNYFYHLYVCSKNEWITEVNAFKKLFIKVDPANLGPSRIYEGHTEWDSEEEIREKLLAIIRLCLSDKYIFKNETKEACKKLLSEENPDYPSAQTLNNVTTLLADDFLTSWLQSAAAHQERRGIIIALMALFRSSLTPFERIFGYGSRNIEEENDGFFSNFDYLRKLHFKFGRSSHYYNGMISIEPTTRSLIFYEEPQQFQMDSELIRRLSHAKEVRDRDEYRLRPGHSTAQTSDTPNNALNVAKMWYTLDHEWGHYLQDFVHLFHKEHYPKLNAKLVYPFQKITKNSVKTTQPSSPESNTEKISVPKIMKDVWDNSEETEQILSIYTQNFGWSDYVPNDMKIDLSSGQRIMYINYCWSDLYVQKKIRFSHASSTLWNQYRKDYCISNPVATLPLMELQRLTQSIQTKTYQTCINARACRQNLFYLKQ